MIDINKKYRTRDGKEVRIYATDHNGDHPVYPVVGAVKYDEGWDIEKWTIQGAYDTCSIGYNLDLIEYDEETELIEEAKRRYPAGTEFMPLSPKSKIVVPNNPIFKLSDGGVSLDFGLGYWVLAGDVFGKEKGQWAKIVEVPEYTMEELTDKLGHTFKIKK